LKEAHVEQSGVSAEEEVLPFAEKINWMGYDRYGLASLVIVKLL